MELSDFLEAIPRVQTALSFGAGFLVGAFTRYINSSYPTPGGAAVSGYLIAAKNRGSLPDYAADIGSALAGCYFGSILVNKLETRKKQERTFKNILRGVRSKEAEEILSKSQENNLH